MIARLMSMGVPADLVREILAGAEWRIVRGRLYVKSSGGGDKCHPLGRDK